MSTCFYDNGGIMEGIDAHTYFTIGPLGVPVPVLFTPHLVGAPFVHPAATWDRTPTVTAESRKMIKRGFKIRLVPHLPIPAGPPHPAAELAQIAQVIAMSSSEAILGVASVTGEGGPLATCVAFCAGANGNCGPGIGAVFNPSSVVTSPTAADFASAVAAFSVGLAFGEVLSIALDDPFAEFVIDKLVGPAIEDAVRSLVEGAF